MKQQLKHASYLKIALKTIPRAQTNPGSGNRIKNITHKKMKIEISVHTHIHATTNQLIGFVQPTLETRKEVIIYFPLIQISTVHDRPVSNSFSPCSKPKGRGRRGGGGELSGNAAPILIQ